MSTTTDFTTRGDTGLWENLDGTELGNYRIERFLGEGGMARVYLARHLTLERPCALKILRSPASDRAEQAAESFLAEARAAAALVHPHVVTIHNVGHDRGHHFIEMEYVDGRSLSSQLAEAGAFDFAEATRLMVEIGSALSLAHAHGMVHRDIKPANVLLNRSRLAKLADFGLAKRIHQAHADDGRILTGTPNYMAPELFDGAPADMRSDVYAMGVTYFQLLTGRLPFQGNTLVDLLQEIRQRPDYRSQDSCRGLPETAAQIVDRCLSADPDQRYDNAHTLLTDLRAAYGCLRSLDSLLRESLREASVAIAGSGNQFEVLVSLPNGRRQKVQVEIAAGVAVAEQVIRIVSVCGAADERHFQRALELNPSFPYGAVGIEMIHGAAHFVMTNVYPRATCDPEEIRHSVLGIAQHADDAERWLSHGDEDVH
ncbi:MAG: serine/threonine-protein kinase [Pirellulaceae bacterium]